MSTVSPIAASAVPRLMAVVFFDAALLVGDGQNPRAVR
jgi:hypothetical protein